MIYRLLTLTALLSLVLSQATPAPVITDNQYGAAYSVAVVHGPGPLVGTFDFKAFAQGVNVAFNMNGFNISDETTYTYHIHEKPVPSDGNCNATGEHFDPYHVGAAHQCDPADPSTCQLGDLSGKHGPIRVNDSAPTFAQAYQDEYLSTSIGNTAFFANLSIVVHRKRDSYRLNCGNFTLYGYPVFANTSTQTQAPSNLSTTLTVDSSISTWLAPSSAVSISSNTTSAVDASAPGPSSSAQYSSSVGSKTSSGIALETGNHGSRHVEVSLLMLGVTAIMPMMLL